MNLDDYKESSFKAEPRVDTMAQWEGIPYCLFSNRAKTKTALRCVRTKLTPCPATLWLHRTSTVWKKYLSPWDKPKKNRATQCNSISQMKQNLDLSCKLLTLKQQQKNLFIIFVMLMSKKCTSVCRFDNDRRKQLFVHYGKTNCKFNKLGNPRYFSFKYPLSVLHSDPMLLWQVEDHDNWELRGLGSISCFH